ncbi:MAG TPA: O-antigen ligase family protein [Candidatus Sulfotelmatobacter sp.]|nr:O-antigen ligase family protein [Candidatus Sulfotelmatobacter sp.]
MNNADRFWIRRTLAQACVIGMICLSITAPAIFLSSDLPFFKVEQILLPLIVGVYLWLYLIGVVRPIRFNWMMGIAAAFLLCNVLSTWYGGAVLGHPVVLRDLYDLPKVFLPAAFFTLAYEAALDDLGLRRLMGWFSAAALLVCVYAWGQFLGLGFAYRLNPYYSVGGHIDLLLEYARRVYGTVGNPNVLGQLMTWCVILFVLAALFRVGNAFCNALTAGACMVTLIMTGSRYGLLTISIGLLLVLLLMASIGRRTFGRIAVLTLVLPAVVWLYANVAGSNQRTLERYQTLQDPLSVDSLRQRLDDVWRQGWRDFLASPVLGHGTGKAYFQSGERVVDSEALGVLREKGVVGFAVFLAYYLYPLYIVRRGYRAIRQAPFLLEQAPAEVMCILATLIIAVLAVIMNVGMSTFYNPFLQGFLWLWLGVGAASASRCFGLLVTTQVELARGSILQIDQIPA